MTETSVGRGGVAGVAQALRCPCAFGFGHRRAGTQPKQHLGQAQHKQPISHTTPPVNLDGLRLEGLLGLCTRNCPAIVARAATPKCTNSPQRQEASLHSTSRPLPAPPRLDAQRPASFAVRLSLSLAPSLPSPSHSPPRFSSASLTGLHFNKRQPRYLCPCPARPNSAYRVLSSLSADCIHSRCKTPSNEQRGSRAVNLISRTNLPPSRNLQSSHACLGF